MIGERKILDLSAGTRFCSACNCEHEIVYVSGIKMIGCPKYPKNKPPTAIIEDDWIEKMKGRK